MSEKLMIFVDFWNTQLNWNRYWKKKVGRVDLDWFNLPALLTAAIQKHYPQLGNIKHIETKIHASTAEQEDNLQEWFDILDKRQGIHVTCRSRGVRRFKHRCIHCGNSIDSCPRCGHALQRAAESQVDVAIAIDMVSLAHEGAYTVAALMSEDSDFLPVVQKLQDMKIKVIGVTWNNVELTRKCWGRVPMSSIMEDLRRNKR